VEQQITGTLAWLMVHQKNCGTNAMAEVMWWSKKMGILFNLPHKY